MEEKKKAPISVIDLVRDNAFNEAILAALAIVREAEETCRKEQLSMPWPMEQVWLDISKLYRK